MQIERDQRRPRLLDAESDRNIVSVIVHTFRFGEFEKGFEAMILSQTEKVIFDLSSLG